MAIEIVDFPMKNSDFPWQNVSSPEGNQSSDEFCSHRSAQDNMQRNFPPQTAQEYSNPLCWPLLIIHHYTSDSLYYNNSYNNNNIFTSDSPFYSQQTTHLGMVYTTYKNGDLVDGLLLF